VTISSPSGLTSLRYDPRGIATQSSKTVFRFTHSSSAVDSVCVSKLGNIVRERCP
jgi:hypothetical protein